MPSQAKSVAVRASLSTTSAISDRIRNLRRTVTRAVGSDEREALSNGLGEIYEAYEEGWREGSDDDDDDD